MIGIDKFIPLVAKHLRATPSRESVREAVAFSISSICRECAIFGVAIEYDDFVGNSIDPMKCFVSGRLNSTNSIIGNIKARGVTLNRVVIPRQDEAADERGIDIRGFGRLTWRFLAKRVVFSRTLRLSNAAVAANDDTIVIGIDPSGRDNARITKREAAARGWEYLSLTNSSAERNQQLRIEFWVSPAPSALLAGEELLPDMVFDEWAEVVEIGAVARLPAANYGTDATNYDAWFARLKRQMGEYYADFPAITTIAGLHETPPPWFFSGAGGYRTPDEPNNSAVIPIYYGRVADGDDFETTNLQRLDPAVCGGEGQKITIEPADNDGFIVFLLPADKANRIRLVYDTPVGEIVMRDYWAEGAARKIGNAEYKSFGIVSRAAATMEWRLVVDGAE